MSPGRAALALGGIVLLAAALRSLVTLSYVQQGSSCQGLTDASARQLAWAMLPIRLLVFGWVMVTGATLAKRLAGRARRAGFVVASAVLAVWLQLFIATDTFSALWPLLALWLVVLVVTAIAIAVALLGRFDRPARWPVSFGAWLLVAGGVTPVVLTFVTGNGEVSVC